MKRLIHVSSIGLVAMGIFIGPAAANDPNLSDLLLGQPLIVDDKEFNFTGFTLKHGSKNIDPADILIHSSISRAVS